MSDETEDDPNDFIKFIRQEMSNGDRAELRRWRPGQTISAPAFWRLNEEYGNLEIHKSPQKWSVIFSALTQTPSSDRTEPPPSFGMAMYAANVSEARMTRLLRAPASRRHDVLLKIIGQLAAARQEFDFIEFKRLVLWPDEAKNRRLARDFYHAEHKDKKDK